MTTRTSTATGTTPSPSAPGSSSLERRSRPTSWHRSASGSGTGGRGGNGDDDWRGRREGGIEGYIEPEIGYWEASESGLDGSDLLVGANIIGVVPFGNVDSFFGAGAGVHFIDAQLVDEDPRADGSETKLGLNAQFGLDLHISEAWSVFGAGRFDLVQGAADNLQAKVYLGLRAAF